MLLPCKRIVIAPQKQCNYGVKAMLLQVD